MKLLKPGEPCPCCGEPIPNGLPGETMILLSRIAELQDLRNLTSVVKCEDCEHQKKAWRKDGRMKNGGEWVTWCERNPDPFTEHTVDGLDGEWCSAGKRRAQKAKKVEEHA